MGLNVLVDLQHLRRQGFPGRVEQGNEQLLDAFSDSDAEGVEVVRHRVQAVQRGRTGDSARNGDGPSFQALLQDSRDVFVLGLTAQRPRLHFSGAGTDPQGTEDVPLDELVQNVVLKGGNQRDRRLLIHLPEQLFPVAGGAEQVGAARGQVLFGLPVLFRGRGCVLAVVLGDQGGLRVQAVMVELPAVLLGEGLEVERVITFEKKARKDGSRVLK